MPPTRAHPCPHELDRDVALQGGVMRSVDRPQPAPTQRWSELVFVRYSRRGPAKQRGRQKSPRRRPAPFAGRLEIEKTESGSLGHLSKLDKLREPDDVPIAPMAGDIQLRIEKMAPRVQAWLSIGGGMLATAVAWFLRMAGASLFAEQEPTRMGAYLRLFTFGCALLGPAGALYGPLRLMWPEPEMPSGSDRLGAGLIEEQRQRRLWMSRLVASTAGILHLLLLLSLT